MPEAAVRYARTEDQLKKPTPKTRTYLGCVITQKLGLWVQRARRLRAIYVAIGCTCEQLTKRPCSMINREGSGLPSLIAKFACRMS